MKSHGRWEVVDDDEVVLMPDKVIRCRFDLNQRCFRVASMTSAGSGPDDRGKLVEITRERFQLRNHSIRPPHRICFEQFKVAPKALPIGEDEITPRRAVASPLTFLR